MAEEAEAKRGRDIKSSEARVDMAGRGLGRHRRGRAPGPLRAEEEVREAHTHTHTHTFESPSEKAENHAEKEGWPEGLQVCH